MRVEIDVRFVTKGREGEGRARILIKIFFKLMLLNVKISQPYKFHMLRKNYEKLSKLGSFNYAPEKVLNFFKNQKANFGLS